ncbi:hypothetical protein ABZ484_04380 [Streptomyces sp. NPDC006393]|uniref:hypothetical protein n=1 Tax=Streptomyces sp. NPDC006393 TaxID=3156763 RepID=UPI00340744CE
MCVADRLLKVFQVCGWLDVYQFYPSLEEATRRAPSGSGGLTSWPTPLASRRQ